VLSGLIHCAQLLVAEYCMQSFPRDSVGDPTALERAMKVECDRYIVNNQRSPVSELSYWRLVAGHAKHDVVTPPTTSIGPNLTVIEHRDIRLEFDDLRAALVRLLGEARKQLEEVLMHGIPAATHYPVALLQDDPSDIHTGHSFLSNHKNGLSTARDWLVGQVSRNPRLASYFFRQPTRESEAPGELPTSTAPGLPLRVQHSAYNLYMHAHQQFLQMLLVLMHMTSGMPARQRELSEISWKNQELPRNLYISHGLMMIVTGYHKTQRLVGTRPVARFLAPAVGELLLQYLIYVPGFVDFLQFAMKRPVSRGYLFADESGDPWQPRAVRDCLGRHTRRVLGVAITFSRWRHMIIAVDRRILRGTGCTVHQVDKRWPTRSVGDADDTDDEMEGALLDDDDLDQLDDARISHLQASHTGRVGNAVYGNDIGLAAGMTDVLLAAYRRSSVGVHEFLGLSPTPTMTGQKRSREEEEDDEGEDGLPINVKRRIGGGSALQVRRKLWNWHTIQDALRQLFGPKATVRSREQGEALRRIAKGYAETVIVMPTGSGKTLLFVLPTMLPGAEVTVVITPLVALRQDLIRRCTEWRVGFCCYSNSPSFPQPHAVPSLLLVDAENASSVAFLTLMQNLNRMGRLDRIVMDEAHLLLTAKHYREQLATLGALRQIKCPFVCLTATLPPFGESTLHDELNLTQPDLLRASSDRPNLVYEVSHLTRPSSDGDAHLGREARLQQEACRLLREMLDTYAGDRAARVICFVRTRVAAEAIGGALGAHVYHAGTEQRDEVLASWIQGLQSPIIAATAALGAGVDYPSVREVLHVDAPSGLLDYAQETGRAGRDQLPARCNVLLAERWRVSWGTAYHSDFLTEDTMQMHHYLQASDCLRRLLTRYLDGDEGTPCTPSATPRMLCGTCQSQPWLASSPPGPPRSITTGSTTPTVSIHQAPTPTRTTSSTTRVSQHDGQDPVNPMSAPMTRSSSNLAPSGRSSPPLSGSATPRSSQSRGNLLNVLKAHASSSTNDTSASPGITTDRDRLRPFVARPGFRPMVGDQATADDDPIEEVDDTWSRDALRDTLPSDGSLGSSRERSQGSRASRVTPADAGSHEQQVYDRASAKVRTLNMNQADARELYVERMTRWVSACIPCSFLQRSLLELHHDRCTHPVESRKRFRSALQMEPYSACYSCAQPQVICRQQGRRGCKFDEIVRTVCYTAMTLDSVEATRMITMMGGPAVRGGDPFDDRFLLWLGKKVRMWGIEGSNAARLTEQWIDRLEAICVRGVSD
jgi:hypothetical protein